MSSRDIPIDSHRFFEINMSIQIHYSQNSIRIFCHLELAEIKQNDLRLCYYIHNVILSMKIYYLIIAGEFYFILKMFSILFIFIYAYT